MNTRKNHRLLKKVHVEKLLLGTPLHCSSAIAPRQLLLHCPITVRPVHMHCPTTCHPWQYRQLPRSKYLSSPAHKHFPHLLRQRDTVETSPENIAVNDKTPYLTEYTRLFSFRYVVLNSFMYRPGYGAFFTRFHFKKEP